MWIACLWIAWLRITRLWIARLIITWWTWWDNIDDYRVAYLIIYDNQQYMLAGRVCIEVHLVVLVEIIAIHVQSAAWSNLVQVTIASRGRDRYDR